MSMTLEEAKVVAVQGERAPLGKVQEALDVLYQGLRDLEIKTSEPRPATVRETQDWIAHGRSEALKELASLKADA